MTTTSSLPLVSICVPAYNADKHLAESLGSALRQTYRPIEIIIYDDGSTDSTLQIAGHYAQKHPEIRVIRAGENQGIAKARNHLIQAARGEYIAFLDSDDLMYPDRIELQSAYLQENPSIAIIGSNYQEYYQKDQFSLFGQHSRVKLKHDEIVLAFSYMCPVPNPCLMARRDVMQSLLFNPEFVSAEDLDFLIRAYKAGYRFANLPHVLTFYRHHADSISSQKKFFMQLYTYLALGPLRHGGQNTPAAEVAEEFKKSRYIQYSSARILSRWDQLKCLLVAPFSAAGRFFLARRIRRFIHV